MDFILCPTDKYMFKGNNKKIRLSRWMYSRLKINTAWHSPGVSIVDSDHSQHINILFLLLTLNTDLSVECERQIIMLWKHRAMYLFRSKSCKAYFIQWFIIASNWNKLWTDGHAMSILWTWYEHMFQL